MYHGKNFDLVHTDTKRLPGSNFAMIQIIRITKVQYNIQNENGTNTTVNAIYIYTKTVYHCHSCTLSDGYLPHISYLEANISTESTRRRMKHVIFCHYASCFRTAMFQSPLTSSYGINLKLITQCSH